jgi:hypothetical protein
MRDGDLTFALSPVLPAQWFTEAPVDVQWGDEQIHIPENAFACALLGSILLVYHNPLRRKTYGPNAVKPVRYRLDTQREMTPPEIMGDAAEQIRRRSIRRLDVWLGS